MNHKEQKDAARAEALEHMQANVMQPRGGKDHEDHKMDSYYIAGVDRDSGDRMPNIHGLKEPKIESYRS
jgi:hypothetical protein